MKSKRRPPFFWDQYNDWARQHYDETGKKPRVATIKQWFDDNAETVWPEPALRPTFLETKRHSKGVRPKANIRAYFRRYRQQRRASRRRRHQRRSLGSGSDGSVSSDSSSGSDEDDEDDDVGRAGNVRAWVRVLVPGAVYGVCFRDLASSAEEDNSAEDSGTDAEGHEEGALRVKHGDTERRHGGAQHPGSTHTSSDDSSPKEYNDDEEGPEEHQVPQDRHEVQPQAKVRSVVPDHSCGPKAPLSETVAAAVAPAPAPAAADTGAGSAGPAAAAEADSSAAPSARPPRRAAAAAASQTWPAGALPVAQAAVPVPPRAQPASGGLPAASGVPVAAAADRSLPDSAVAGSSDQREEGSRQGTTEPPGAGKDLNTLHHRRKTIAWQQQLQGSNPLPRPAQQQLQQHPQQRHDQEGMVVETAGGQPGAASAGGLGCDGGGEHGTLEAGQPAYRSARMRGKKSCASSPLFSPLQPLKSSKRASNASAHPSSAKATAAMAAAAGGMRVLRTQGGWWQTGLEVAWLRARERYCPSRRWRKIFSAEAMLGASTMSADGAAGAGGPSGLSAAGNGTFPYHYGASENFGTGSSSGAPSSNDDLLYDMVMSRNGGGAGGLRASPRDGAAAAAGMSPASLLQQSMPPPPARLQQQSMLATGLLPAGGSLRKRAGSNDGSAALDHAGGRGAAGDAGGLDEQVGPRAVRKQRVVRFSFGEVTALDEVGTGAAVGMAATDARQQAAEGRHYTGTPGGGGAEAGGGATGAAQQEAAAGEAELNTGQSNVVSAFGSLASEPGLSRDAGQQAAAEEAEAAWEDGSLADALGFGSARSLQNSILRLAAAPVSSLGSATPGGLLASCRLARQASVDWNELLNPRLSEGLDLFGFCYSSQPSATKPRLSGGAPYEAAELATSGAAGAGLAGIGGAVFGGSATGAAGLSGPAVGAGAAGTYDINAGTAWRTQQHHLLSQPPQQQHLIHQSKQQQQAIAGHQGWGAAGRGGAAWDLLLGSNQSQPRQQLQHLQHQHQQTTSATAAVAAIATLRAGAYEDPYHQARPAATLQYQYQQAHADILQQLHLRAHSAAAAAASTASGVAGASSAAWGDGSANVMSGYGRPRAQQQALGALGLVTADGSGQYAATGSAAAAVPRAAQLGLELGGYGHSRIYGSGDLNAGGSLRQQHQQHQQLQHYPNLPPAWPQATAPPASEGWAAAMGAALRLAGGGGGPSAAEAAPLQHQGGAPGSGTDGGSAGAVLMPHRAVSTGGSALTTEDASEMSETSQGGARGSYGYDTGAY
eukprot:XP_001694815.1 predicted protein [Chlamydomonas reinhardtii]